MSYLLGGSRSYQTPKSEPKKPKTPVKQQNQPAEPVVTQQQQHQQQPVRTSTIIKEVKLHKNGDPTTNPVVYTYHSKEGHNFDEVVHHMGQLVPPKNGQPANALYTHDGTMKITNLTQLADVNEDHFVVAHGNYEPVEGGYLRPVYRESPKIEESPKPDDKPAEKRPATSKQRVVAARPKSSKPAPVKQPPQQTSDQQSDDKMGVIKRIYVFRCGDPKYKAHTYIYRSRHVRSNWDALCEDLTKIAPPIHGGPVVKLFTTDGDEILHVKELEPNTDYVACGVEGFVDVHGGYERIGHRDGTVAKQGAGGRETPIYERKDQTNPENILIHVFRNGHGLESQMFTYKKKELDKGLPWIKERIAHKMQTNGKRLCTIDGREIAHTNDLVNRGCYVLVPSHEKFREDTYYYMPENSVDTSGDADDSENPKEVRRHQRIDSARQVSPAGRAPSRPESVGQSDYLSEYDASRGTTPVDSYDSEPEDPFPRKQERLKSAGTSPIRTLAVPTNRSSRPKSSVSRTRHASISPIPSRQYQDKLEPFSHSRPYQQQPQPQRQPTNLHRNPTNISRRPQTAFTEPEYYGDYGEPMRPKSQNRPDWVDPNKIRSVLEEKDPFKNQPIRPKGSEKSRNNEPLPYMRRPTKQQQQQQWQDYEAKKKQEQDIINFQQRMQKQFKPAPVYNPHVISKRPIEATLQRPVAKEPVFHTRIKPATTHPPVRRRSDTDIFYAKEPIKRGPVDLDKDPGGIFKAKKPETHSTSKPARQPTARPTLKQTLPPPAKVN